MEEAKKQEKVIWFCASPFLLSFIPGFLIDPIAALIGKSSQSVIRLRWDRLTCATGISLTFVKIAGNVPCVSASLRFDITTLTSPLAYTP